MLVYMAYWWAWYVNIFGIVKNCLHNVCVLVLRSLISIYLAYWCACYDKVLSSQEPAKHQILPWADGG